MVSKEQKAICLNLQTMQGNYNGFAGVDKKICNFVLGAFMKSVNLQPLPLHAADRWENKQFWRLRDFDMP